MESISNELFNQTEYLTVEQVLELPMFRHLKPATLAKWRISGHGPPFVRVGRTPFYRRSQIELWLLKEEKLQANAIVPTEMPLPPIQVAGQPKRKGFHRWGRHRTKREKAEEEAQQALKEKNERG